MNLEQMLLIKLMEECSEVAQACAKGLRFGLYDKCDEASVSNQTYIMNELKDVTACMELMFRRGYLARPTDMEVYGSEIESRIARISKYLDYSKNLGIYTP